MKMAHVLKSVQKAQTANRHEIIVWKTQLSLSLKILPEHQYPIASSPSPMRSTLNLIQTLQELIKRIKQIRKQVSQVDDVKVVLAACFKSVRTFQPDRASVSLYARMVWILPQLGRHFQRQQVLVVTSR